MAFYCNGLKGVCNCPILCIDCEVADWQGGVNIEEGGYLMEKTKGIPMGRIFGKRIWKMVYTRGKKPPEYYIGETRVPKWICRMLCKRRK